MSQQNTASQSVVQSDVALARNIDVLGQKLASLESRIAAAGSSERGRPAPIDNERDLKRLLDLSSEPAVVHAGGNVIYANPSAQRLCGASGPQKLLGLSYLSLIHPDYRSLMKVRLASLRSHPDREDSANVVALGFDGGEFSASIRMVAITWRGEQAVLSFYREQPEKGLPQTSGDSPSYPLILEDAIWLWQVDTGAVHVGALLGNLLGDEESPDAGGFAGWEALVHEDDLPALRNALELCGESADGAFDAELRLKSQRGALVWIRLTGRALRDLEGQIYRVIGTAEDISRLKDLEARLTANEKELAKSRRVIASRTAALASREEELDQARRLVDATNGELAAREEELAQTRQLLQLRTSELTLRRGELTELRQIREDVQRESEEREACLQAKTAETSAIESELSLAKEQLSDLNDQLSERGKDLDDVRRSLTEREAELSKRDAELVEAKARLGSREAQLAARDADLLRFREALQGRTATLVSLKKGLAEANARIERDRSKLADKNDALRQSGDALLTARLELAAQETALDAARVADGEKASELDARRTEISTLRAQLAESASLVEKIQADNGEIKLRLDQCAVQLDERTAELKNSASLLVSRSVDIAARDAALADMRDQLERGVQRLEQLETEKAGLRELLDLRCAELADREEALTKTASLLDARTADLAARQAELAEVQSAWTEQQAALKESEADLHERDTELAHVRALSEERESEIASLKDAMARMQELVDSQAEESARREEEFARVKRALASNNERLVAQEEALTHSRATLDAHARELAARAEDLGRARMRINGQESAIRELQNVANHAGHVQSQFLAGVSHELLTPLNAIKGFAEVIGEEMFGELEAPQYREYAADIVSSADHLRGMINDLLELSRITARKVDIREEILDAGVLLKEGLRRITTRAEESELRVDADIPADLPAVKADGHMTRQMLLNLLTNAVNFTPKGGVIEAAAFVAQDGGLSIAVRDTGPGISDGIVDDIMAPLGDTAGDISVSNSSKGLGLSLVRAQIELHGGRLEIETGPNAGTTVTLHFPPDRTVN